MAPLRRRRLKRKARRRKVDFNGHPPIPGRKLRLAIKVAHIFGLVVTSTTGGRHSPNSYHYHHRAVDLASGSVRRMRVAQLAIRMVVGRRNLRELFGPAGWYVKNGVKYRGYFPKHGDHIHVAI